MCMYEATRLATYHLLLVVTLNLPQPAVTMERAQVKETTGEVTQDDGSQYCESLGYLSISLTLTLPDFFIAHYRNDETGSYVYVYFKRVAVLCCNAPVRVLLMQCSCTIGNTSVVLRQICNSPDSLTL